MDLTPTSTPVLRNPMKTMDATLQYMRDVTVIVMSQIAWYRCLCPETSFKKKWLLNYEFNMLRVTDDSVTKYFIQNMAGAFEALNQRYLKSFTMNIRDVTGDFLLESYKMTYKYEEGSSPSVDISSTCSSISSGSVRSPTSLVYIKTLDMLLKLEKSLTEIIGEPLSNESLVDFTLSYYSYTPRNYIPPGFRFHTEEELEKSRKFLDTSLRFRQGRIESDFGTLGCSSEFAKSLIRQSEDVDQSD